MPDDNTETPFENLFDEIDTLDSLLSEGPGCEPGDSAAFLNTIEGKLKDALAIVQSLTAEDVDAEYTEVDDNDPEEAED